MIHRQDVAGNLWREVTSCNQSLISHANSSYISIWSNTSYPTSAEPVGNISTLLSLCTAERTSIPHLKTLHTKLHRAKLFYGHWMSSLNVKEASSPTRFGVVYQRIRMYTSVYSKNGKYITTPFKHMSAKCDYFAAFAGLSRTVENTVVAY